LPAHLKRVVRRLSEARADSLGAEFDVLIDRVARELDDVLADGRSIRGARRRQVLDRLAALDHELVQQARATLDDARRADLAREADTELAPFRSGMAPDAFARAHDAAIDRLVRQRLRLPTIAFV
jgi:hypothetical protein